MIAKIEKDERMQLLQGLGTSAITTAKVDVAVDFGRWSDIVCKKISAPEQDHLPLPASIFLWLALFLFCHLVGIAKGALVNHC